MTTIYIVARVAGVSTATVSRVLRGSGQRLLARISEPALPPRAEILPTSAVIRASCGCLPTHGDH